MKLTTDNLKTLGTGFGTAYQGGLGQAPAQHLRLATKVPSTTGKEEYGWLGKIPAVREWLGARVVQNIKVHDYAIKNKDYELTVGVDRNDILDDNIGIYGPLFTEMGMATGVHANQLVFALLKAGFTNLCYDGQYFFDVDHPVLDENGVEQSIANTDGGSGTPWFLVDSTRALKPIIWQLRQDWDFVARDKVTDDNVFDLKEFRYGADARMSVGYGFWQFVWGSKQTLNAASYAAARAALMNMKGDHGKPIGVMPNLLVVPPTLESPALKILNNDLGANGETNEWKGTAELLNVPWLA